MNIAQQCTAELLQLMKSLGDMLDAVDRGEPMPALSPDQAKTLMLTVADSMLINRRTMLAQAA